MTPNTTNPTVKMFDLRDAYEFCSAVYEESAAYICRKTGVIYWDCPTHDLDPPPEDCDDETKYAAVPDKFDLNMGNRLVFAFAESHLPDCYDQVRRIFRRPGAYARFKDLLDEHGAPQRWYDYKNAATEAAFGAWCADEGIELQDV
jgi:hypothetical protein